MVNEQSDNQKKRERIVIETGSSMIDRAHIDNAIEYPPEITESLNQNDDNIIEPPITIESLEHAIDQSYDIYHLTCCDNFELEIMYGETKSAIAVMASILRNHGVCLQRPQKAGYEPKSDYQHFPDDNESLCRRYFATRESLIKSGDQLVLRKETKMIQNNKPCEMQEEVITKKEAASWMKRNNVFEGHIFHLLGEKPPKEDEDNLPLTITNKHNDKQGDSKHMTNGEHMDSGSKPPTTVESLITTLKHIESIYYYLCFDSDILERWCNEAKDELVVTASILRDNGIPYDPKGNYELANLYHTFPHNAGSIYAFYFAKRESLRKSGDQLVLRKEIKKIKSNKPCEMQEEVITKKEAIEWLQGTGATDAEIFGITGERPEAAGEGLLRSTISENNICKGNRIFVAR